MNRQIEVLATFVHGALFGLHTLAFFYNAYRGSKRDALIHGAALTYDLVASYRHLQSIPKPRDDESID